MKTTVYIAPSVEINPVFMEASILAGSIEEGAYADESDANQSYFDGDCAQAFSSNHNLWDD